MTFTPLASSSHGNCYIVSDGRTAIMLECGIPFRRLKKALGFDLTAIRGCLVSHEHKDHSLSIKNLIQSGVEVFASEGTSDALDCGLVTTIAAKKQFQIGSLEIVPFATFHDAAEPLGFLIYSREDGDRLVFATDTVILVISFQASTCWRWRPITTPQFWPVVSGCRRRCASASRTATWKSVRCAGICEPRTCRPTGRCTSYADGGNNTLNSPGKPQSKVKESRVKYLCPRTGAGDLQTGWNQRSPSGCPTKKRRASHIKLPG